MITLVKRNGRPSARHHWRLLAVSAMLAVPFAGTAAPTTVPGPSGVLAEVRRTGKLRVCVVADYAGVTMRDARTGRLSGIDIDLSKRLAAQLTASVEYVETTFLRFPDDLESRRCQIAMMGIWVSENRKQRVDFSIPYVTSGAYVVVARANSRLGNWADVDRPSTVLAVVNTPDLLGRANHLLPMATKLPATDSEPMRELIAGRADAVIVDYAMANTLQRTANWARVIAPPRPALLTEIAYAVPKGEPAWLERVNGFVRAIKADGSLRRAVELYGLSGLGIPE